MKKLAVLVAAFALSTLVPAAASGMSADPVHRIRFGVATNWAGYVAHGGPFTSVSTSWTEPSITCPSKSNSAVASFAGLDGSTSSTVEQIGTVDLCKNGVVSHIPFFEMFPRGAQNIAHSVQAGNSMTATVTVTAPKTFTLKLVNNSQGWSFSTQQRSAKAKLSSAEAITEAPTRRGSGVVTLANFGTINYGGTMANEQPIGNFAPEEVTMVSNSGTIKAQPSALSSTAFAVYWQHG